VIQRQTTVADVLKAIIAISANSSDAGVIGPNALSRDLVSEATIKKILDYMLDPTAPHSTASLTNGVSLIIELIRKNNRLLSLARQFSNLVATTTLSPS
jgi:SIT4 phosphatase-associated protein